jgi:hypothetical protein
MRKGLFEELLESVEQSVAIERGRMKPSRSFSVSSKNEIRAVRAKLALS